MVKLWKHRKNKTMQNHIIIIEMVSSMVVSSMNDFLTVHGANAEHREVLNNTPFWKQNGGKKKTKAPITSYRYMTSYRIILHTASENVRTHFLTDPLNFVNTLSMSALFWTQLQRSSQVAGFHPLKVQDIVTVDLSKLRQPSKDVDLTLCTAHGSETNQS
jgi:hypothetical protein